MKTFFTSNTIRLALAAILGLWATFFANEVSLQDAVSGSVVALLAIFLRRGATVPIVKAVLLCAILGLVAGCSFSYNPKYQEIKPNAFPFARPPSSTTEVEGQATETPGEEMILPDGSYFTTSGGGSAGNFWLILMQNDGTSQESRGSASAAATVQSPGSTTGSTTADEGATGTTTTTGGEGSGEPVEDSPE